MEQNDATRSSSGSHTWAFFATGALLALAAVGLILWPQGNAKVFSPPVTLNDGSTVRIFDVCYEKVFQHDPRTLFERLLDRLPQSAKAALKLELPHKFTIGRGATGTLVLVVFHEKVKTPWLHAQFSDGGNWAARVSNLHWTEFAPGRHAVSYRLPLFPRSARELEVTLVKPGSSGPPVLRHRFPNPGYVPTLPPRRAPVVQVQHGPHGFRLTALAAGASQSRFESRTVNGKSVPRAVKALPGELPMTFCTFHYSGPEGHEDVRWRPHEISVEDPWGRILKPRYLQGTGAFTTGFYPSLWTGEGLFRVTVLFKPEGGQVPDDRWTVTTPFPAPNTAPSDRQITEIAGMRLEFLGMAGRRSEFRSGRTIYRGTGAFLRGTSHAGTAFQGQLQLLSAIGDNGTELISAPMTAIASLAVGTGLSGHEFSFPMWGVDVQGHNVQPPPTTATLTFGVVTPRQVEFVAEPVWVTGTGDQQVTQQ